MRFRICKSCTLIGPATYLIKALNSLWEKDIQDTITFDQVNLFDVVFFLTTAKIQLFFFFFKPHARRRVVWHLKRHDLKDLQSTSHGKTKVILNLQSESMGVKVLTQNIYIYIIIATCQQSYGDAMVTTSGCFIKQKIYHP